MSNYYRLSTYDERDNNWITLRDNLKGAPLVYMAYLDCLCPVCHCLDRDAVFARKQGLEAGPRIRVRSGRELAHSGDGFLCIKARILELLQTHGVAGYETRPLPKTEWHVLRITSRVPYKEFVPKRGGPQCKKCGRQNYYGIPLSLRDIGLPPGANTFFAPELERASMGQDIYITEDVARMLKTEGVKGAELARLLDDQEARSVLEAGESAWRKLKDVRIYL